jgi:hypothetical protein
MEDVRKEVNYLRVEFTREEKEEFGQELARTAATRDEAVDGKKAATAQFGEKIARAEADLASLARKINNGYEFKNVECEVQLDKPKKGFATVIRLDTKAKVNERPMTPDELQRKLDMEAAEAEKSK